MTSRGGAALSSALVAGLAVVLHLLGSGELAGPPLTDPGELGAWYDDRSPATVTIALVRFVAELSAWYVLGLGVVHGVARLLGARGLGQLAEALALPGTRRLVRAGLGVGLLAATATGGGGDASERAAPSGTATMRPIAPPVSSPTTDAGTARMVPLPADTGRPTGVVTSEAETVTAKPPPTRATTSEPATWPVAPDESMWSIAEQVLGDRLGRPPTDAEIDPYWRALVETNRGRLVDPADADLIHAGQVFELPLVSATEAAPSTATSR